MLSFANHADRSDLVLGLVTARQVVPGQSSADLDNRIESLVAERQKALEAQREKARRLSREILRNGTYKPSGRGKPANEFLLRAAQDGSFPRVSNVVDTINYISLKYMVPISVWDVDAAAASTYEFRKGKGDEEYVFNNAGHSIKLRDLIVGCAVASDGKKPIVNPVKDSMYTKIGKSTSNIAICLYFHVDIGDEYMREATSELINLISQCGQQVVVREGRCGSSHFIELV